MRCRRPTCPCCALLAVASLIAACGRAGAPSRIVVACPSGPVSLAPNHSTEEFTVSVLSNAYEGLIEMDRALEPRAALAETWYAENDTTWVFRLKEGLRFHDGRPVDAAAAAASLEQARLDPSSQRRTLLAAIDAVEVRDVRTVVVRTRGPVATLPSRVAGVPIWRDPAVAGQPPAGTGPYRVRTFESGGDAILEAFEEHRDGRPATRVLEFRAVPDAQERLRLVRAGEAHLAVDVPAEAAASLAQDPRARLVTERGLRVVFLGMDCARDTNPRVSGVSRNPFRDARVRRAVALAIDATGLTTGPLGGYAERASQLVVPSVFGYHPHLPPVRHDPSEAQRLLVAAGYGNGFGVELDFMPHKYRAMDAIAAQITGDLAKVRIRVSPRAWEASDLLPRITGGDTAFYLLGWMNTGGEAGAAHEYLVHTRRGDLGQYNGGGFSNAELDGLLARATVRFVPDERRQLLHAVAEVVQDQLPVIPLYWQTDLYAVARELNFEPRADRMVRGATLRLRPRRGAGGPGP